MYIRVQLLNDEFAYANSLLICSTLIHERFDDEFFAMQKTSLLTGGQWFQTGGFLIEPVRIFECFLGQGFSCEKKQRKSGIYEKSVKKEGCE